MKKIFLLLLVILFFSCKEIKQEVSEVLHEDATIVNTVFTPSTHRAEVGMAAIGGKTGSIGIDFSGNVGIGLGNGLQISSVTVPEKFAVVFECKHGGFISQGTDIRHKDLYERFKERKGSEVDVTYKEIYRVTYDDVDKDGKKEVIERVLVDYDFLNALPKKGD